MVWCGVDEKSRGKGKEGCARLFAPRVWKGIEAHGWKGSRIVCAVGKIGIVKYAWVCVYAPVNSSNGRGKEEMRKFWNDVNECLRSFERGNRIVLMGDMNGRVGRNEIAGVVGKWGLDGINEIGKHVVDVCAERGLFLANPFFQHRLVHRYTWRRIDERDEQKSLMDYTAVDERIKKDVLDARVMRGLFDGSDHYAVVAKIQIRGRWEYSKKCKSKGDRL